MDIRTAGSPVANAFRRNGRAGARPLVDRCRRWLAACAMLLVLAQTLGASTNNFRAVILACRQETGKNGKVTWLVTVRKTWGNKVCPDTVTTLKVDPATAHIFLDGKPARPEEAFRPGHMFKSLGDCNYFECYPTDFRFPAEDGGPTAERGVYRLNLRNAGQYVMIDKRRGKESERDHDLVLYVACREGRVEAAGVGGPDRLSSFPVDASGLSIVDGVLTGVVKTTLLSGGKQFPKRKGRIPCTYTLEVPLGKDEVEGTYRGQRGDEDLAGTVSATGRALPVLAGSYTAWLMCTRQMGLTPADSPMKGGEVAFTMRVEDGRLTDGIASIMKGKGCGPVTAAALTIDGHRITGEITYDDHGEEHVCRIDGVVVGDMIFGEATIDGEPAGGEETASSTRFRGELVRVEAPPFMQWDERAAKKHMKAHPDEPIPDELMRTFK